MCPSDAVWPIRNYHEPGALDQVRGPQSRGCDRHSAIRVAVNHQCGNVYAGQILAEVLLNGSCASDAGNGRGTGGDVPACLDRLLADALPQQQVRVVEIFEKLCEERVTV